MIRLQFFNPKPPVEVGPTLPRDTYEVVVIHVLGSPDSYLVVFTIEYLCRCFSAIEECLRPGTRGMKYFSLH